MFTEGISLTALQNSLVTLSSAIAKEDWESASRACRRAMSVRKQVIDGNFAGSVVVSCSFHFLDLANDLQSPHRNIPFHHHKTSKSYVIHSYRHSEVNLTQQLNARISLVLADFSGFGLLLEQRKKVWKLTVILSSAW